MYTDVANVYQNSFYVDIKHKTYILWERNMYGQLHCIVRELVLEKFGKETWEDILVKSKLDKHTDFIVFKRFPDYLTFRLVGAVSEVVGLSVETVLQVFGGFFLTYCLRHGYDKMLKTLGGDIISFIQNLDCLHSLLALSYTGIEAPSFRCEVEDEENLILHYYSMRDGLYPIVIGLVEAVGKELFSQKCTLTVISRTAEEAGTRKIQHHTVFRVQMEYTGRSVAFLRNESALSMRSTKMKVRGGSDVDPQTMLACSPRDSLLKADDFCEAFPYHLVLSENMTIEQVGNNVRRATLMHIWEGMPLNDVADIVQPVIIQNMDNIFKFINAVFIISIYRSATDRSKPFNLKGQMCWMKQSRKMVFIGSPRMTSLNDLLEMKLYLADIPLYDCTRELVLLNQQRIAEIDIAKKLDETTHMLEKMSRALEVEKQKTEDLLHQMLPKKVARQLTQGVAVKAEKFECVTILFSDIVTFTNIAGACNPMDVVNMLNDLYHLFDTRTNLHDVYKVETIGDAYMGVAGVPEVQEDHAECVANFAMDVLEESCKVLSPATGRPLQIRVGIHSGPVVAGVVGKKMPRYCLFGDTVNTASRMESHGVPGRIHVSETTQVKLLSYGYIFLQREGMDIKGKGKMDTFFLVGCRDRSLLQPSDEFSQLPRVATSHPITRTTPQKKPRDDATRQSFNFFQKDSESTVERTASKATPTKKTLSMKKRTNFCLII